MFILTSHWDVRLFWGVLPVTAKFYLFCLLIAAAHTVYFLTRTLSRLHRLPQGAPSSEETCLRLSLFELTNGMETLRQFHTLLFLLFGVFFADEMFATIRGIRLYSASLSGARMDIFEAPTAFAFIVFVVLVFLHAFQWVVAARLQSHRAANPNHVSLLDD
jgi:hypothetical protein